MSAASKLDPTLVEVRAIVEQKEREEEEKRKAERKKARQPQRLEGDVEPAIDTSHLDVMEREQRREIIERVTPTERTLGPSSVATQAAFAAGRQAREIAETVQDQDIIFDENLQQAEATFNEIKDLPADEPAVTVETEEGPVTLTRAEYRKFIDDYKTRYQKWRSKAVEASGKLVEAKRTVLSQVSDWSKAVVARTAAVNQQTRDFNDQLKARLGFATMQEREPITEGLGIRGVPPGPVAGAAPGSFGEKLQEHVARGLALAEKPFVAATTPIRTRAERLRREATEEKAGFKGFSKYLEGVALATGASAFDVATISVRPGLAVKSAVGIGKLVTDPEERKALAETVAADPFGFTAETLGGAYFGAKLADFGRTAIRQTGPVTRAIKAELAASPRAPFSDILRRAKFVAERETAVVDFSKLLKEETAFRFPEEVVEAEFLETFIPEKTFTTKEVFTFEPLPRGKFRPSGFKGFGRTGAELVPMIIPEEFVVPTTIYKFRRTPLTIPSGRPGIPISVPQLGITTRPSVSFMDVLTGASIAATRPTVKRPETLPQIQRPGTIQQNLQRFRQTQKDLTRNILAPPTGITALKITQPQLQPQRQPQIFEQVQIQKQRLDVPQIQTPQMPTPQRLPPIPTILLPPRPPRKPKTTTILNYDPRKKKRKPTKARGIKKAVEKRIDPLEVINWDPRKRRKKR